MGTLIMKVTFEGKVTIDIEPEEAVAMMAKIFETAAGTDPELSAKLLTAWTQAVTQATIQAGPDLQRQWMEGMTGLMMNPFKGFKK